MQQCICATRLICAPTTVKACHVHCTHPVGHALQRPMRCSPLPLLLLALQLTVFNNKHLITIYFALRAACIIGSIAEMKCAQTLDVHDAVLLAKRGCPQLAMQMTDDDVDNIILGLNMNAMVISIARSDVDFPQKQLC